MSVLDQVKDSLKDGLDTGVKFIQDARMNGPRCQVIGCQAHEVARDHLQVKLPGEVRAYVLVCSKHKKVR